MEFDRPAPPQYAEAAERARNAMRDGADVLFQPTFHVPASTDGTGFIGFADFIIRNARGEYEVYDTKLARHAKISALLQLAAYAEQMRANDIPTGQQVHLVLGDRTTTTHDLADIVPVYRTQRAELIRVIAERLAADEPMQWGGPALLQLRPVLCLPAGGAATPRPGPRRRHAPRPADEADPAGRPVDRRPGGPDRAGGDHVEDDAGSSGAAGEPPDRDGARSQPQRRCQPEPRSSLRRPGCTGTRRDPGTRSWRRLLRLRGRPAPHRGRRALGPRLPVRPRR
ncbi:hypothetical protein [Curtobacterium sp. MCJR17_043]|uniref:hypothetical protein n=1 Tax=Curtobacterium sp. MCJR17_043 TaxID=2175660 RepID=UPI0024DFF1D3|nr:hypothetical protein [Curtobacterium sp. MCJR17_043]WIB36963.1 hypothetical protein DEJ15_08455 [Curtobacterium sp. MCJR17_043]